MAKNEHLKKKLRTPDELPDSLTWEKIQHGIQSKVDMQTITYKKLSFYKLLLTTLAIGSIAVVLAFYFLGNEEGSEKQAMPSVDIVKQQEVKGYDSANAMNTNEIKSQQSATGNSDNIAVEQSTKTETKRLQKTDNSNKQTLKQAESIVPNNNYTSNDLSVLTQNIDPKKKNVDHITSSNSSRNNRNNYTTAAENIEAQVGLFNTENSAGSNTKLTPSNNNYNINDRRITRANGLQRILLSSLESNKPNQADSYSPVVSTYEAPSVLSISHKPFSVELAVGTNLFNPNFGGTELGDAKSTYNKAVIGLGAEFLLNYSWSDTWQISTGLNYQALENKLDYYNEKEFIENRNEISHIFVNSISKDSTFHYSNRDVSITKWELVKHYNKNTIISIPILLNRTWNLKKDLQFLTGLGMQYNLRSSSLGKAIVSDQGEKSTYQIEEYGDNIYSIQSNMHALLNTSLHYAISDRVYLGLGLRGSLALKDWSTQIEYTARPLTMDARFKLGYRF